MAESVSPVGVVTGSVVIGHFMRGVASPIVESSIAGVSRVTGYLFGVDAVIKSRGASVVEYWSW